MSRLLVLVFFLYLCGCGPTYSPSTLQHNYITDTQQTQTLTGVRIVHKPGTKPLLGFLGARTPPRSSSTDGLQPNMNGRRR